MTIFGKSYFVRWIFELKPVLLKTKANASTSKPLLGIRLEPAPLFRTRSERAEDPQARLASHQLEGESGVCAADGAEGHRGSPLVKDGVIQGGGKVGEKAAWERALSSI